MYFSRNFSISLAFEYFISKKTLASVVQGKKVSKPIVRISIVSIALAVVVNLITIAVVTGFQQEVRQKISGFGAHIFIMGASEGSVYESEPILKNQAFLKPLREDPGIHSIANIGYKPVLFQSDAQERTYQLNGKDTTEIQYQVHGAIIKGVDSTYDWRFFQKHLTDGTIPDFNLSKNLNKIIISKQLSQKLGYKTGDTVGAFFVRNRPVKRSFVISGIYETGLAEFDQKIVIGSLANVQELNDWGITAKIEVPDTVIQGQLVVRGDVHGGNGVYRYDWGRGFDTYIGFPICPRKDTLIRLVASDYWTTPKVDISETTVPDTAYIRLTVDNDSEPWCEFELNEFGKLDRSVLDDDGHLFYVHSDTKRVTVALTQGKGSFSHYVGGFEIMVNDWEALDEVLSRIRKNVEMRLTEHGEILKVTSIVENEPDIFVWLGFLDINVVIILTLMILIGIINMGSALLVLILIRSNFIGMMKAMGATNWSIRKIFLIQAGFLISRGMLWGNMIGVGICLLQKYTGILSLNPEVYYLSQVPIELDIWHWLLLNIGTLLVCMLALIVPSVVITRIDPVKAIKFN